MHDNSLIIINKYWYLSLAQHTFTLLVYIEKVVFLDVELIILMSDLLFFVFGACTSNYASLSQSASFLFWHQLNFLWSLQICPINFMIWIGFWCCWIVNFILILKLVVMKSSLVKLIDFFHFLMEYFWSKLRLSCVIILQVEININCYTHHEGKNDFITKTKEDSADKKWAKCWKEKWQHIIKVEVFLFFERNHNIKECSINNRNGKLPYHANKLCQTLCKEVFIAVLEIDQKRYFGWLEIIVTRNGHICMGWLVEVQKHAFE